MGKITSQLPNATTSNHFSHPHPLKLCNYDQTQTLNPSPSSSCCSACKLKPSGFIYTCTTCTYFLHKKCFEMPNKITHPFHNHHSFTLLPKPAYEEGSFKCDACWGMGDGFSYHCKPCGIDLHILCAVMPLSVTHPCHAHKLDLTFGSPYLLEKEFNCDVCKTRGLDHWLYRCNSCGFDAHLNCATTVTPVHVQVQPPSQQQNFMGYGQQQFMGPRPPAVGVPAAGNPFMSPSSIFQVNRQQNEVFLQAMQQMIDRNKAMTQAALSSGGFGGGVPGFGDGVVGGGVPGLGGDNGMQQLTQFYSNLATLYGGNPAGLNTTFGGQDYLSQLAQMNGGGGGNGMMPGLNNFGGGGGAGTQEFLQALMNNAGSGGGGTELLQSLLGGGGGGLDFLSGALGGFSF